MSAAEQEHAAEREWARRIEAVCDLVGVDEAQRPAMRPIVGTVLGGLYEHRRGLETRVRPGQIAEARQGRRLGSGGFRRDKSPPGTS